MKKALLLTLLAGSMLASCTTAAKLNVNKNVKADPLAGIVEDCEAHEEVFGPATEGIKATPMREQFYSDEVGIGIQTKDNKDDTISIRFVGAITAPNLAGSTAVWQRGIYDDYGTSRVEGEMESTKVYTSITNGDDVLTIAAYNTAHSTSHTGFVVYSILNIPKDTYNKNYLTAYLKFTDSNSILTRSKAIVTTIDQSTQFAIDDPETYLEADISFGVQYTSGVFTPFAANTSAPNADDGGGSGNLAVFDDLELTGSKSFVAIRRSNSRHFFNVSGYDKLVAGDSRDKDFYTRVGTSGAYDFVKMASNTAYSSLTCSFYMSGSFGNVGKLYLGYARASVTLSLNPTWAGEGNTWNKDGAYMAVHIFEKEKDAEATSWAKMTDEDSDGIFTVTATVFVNGYIIFCRMNGAYPTPSWEGGHVYNQTANLHLLLPKTLFELNDWTTGSWN